MFQGAGVIIPDGLVSLSCVGLTRESGDGKRLAVRCAGASLWRGPVLHLNRFSERRPTPLLSLTPSNDNDAKSYYRSR